MDDLDSDCPATPSGIMQCLRMLAEEAATLNLSHTLHAINEALEACAREGSETATPEARGPVTLH
jgi:hypothetical protein